MNKNYDDMIIEEDTVLKVKFKMIDDNDDYVENIQLIDFEMESPYELFKLKKILEYLKDENKKMPTLN